MNSTVFRISLDIHEVNSQVTLHVKKGDIARQILIALTEGGRPYRISEDCMAVFTAKKPDDTILYNGCEIQGNRILYAMTPQTCTAVGAMKCEIRVYGADGALITSPRFTILVDDTVYSDGDVVDSASEFSALTALVVQAKELVESLEVAERKVVIAKAPLGVDYTAEVEELELTTGTEILLLPQSANASAPTLSINGGEAYPLCLRPGWNITGDDRNPQLTLPIPEGMLLRGAEYVFRYDGYSWILQSYVDRPARGYVDVTESFRADDDYRDHPEEYLRSLGPGKWLIDDEWAIYKMEIFEIDGQEWRNEQSWTDNGIYTLRMYNAGREVLYIDTADEEIRVNGSAIGPGEGSGVSWEEMQKYVAQEIQKIPVQDLSEYATEEFVRTKIAEAQLGGNVDLSDYATQEDLKAVAEKEVKPLNIQGASWLNWFDYNNHINNYESNKYINPKNGVISDLNGWYVFPKILLLGGKTYTMSGSLRYCVMYNAEDDSYIKTISNNASTKNPVTFEVDESYSEVYLRFCDNAAQNNAYLSDKFMIVEGDTIPDVFMPHEAVISWLNISDKKISGAQLVDGSVAGEKLKPESVDGNKIINKTLSTSKLSAYLGSENLYNSALADRNLWHSANGTAPGSSSGYFASPLIPVTPGRKYYVYGAMDTATKASGYTIQTAYSAYEVNSEGVYTKISFAEDEPTGKAIVYTAGEGAKYLAFNARDSYIDKFVVSEKFRAYCPPYIAQLANTQNVVQGHYAGGTLVALGDSITRGCSNGETLEDGTVLANGGQIPKPYANYAAELLGMYCKNFGVDGATVKTVLVRIQSTDYMAGLKAQPDIITVKIGTNDMAQVALGTINDVYDAANVTYYSGLKEIARLLSEGFPESAIVFITPLRANNNARSYVKAMEEVAEMYDIPCMQMHKVLRYMQQNADGSYYINDHYNGLHPNQAAHLRMGRALAGFLQTV